MKKCIFILLALLGIQTVAFCDSSYTLQKQIKKQQLRAEQIEQDHSQLMATSLEFFILESYVRNVRRIATIAVGIGMIK